MPPNENTNPNAMLNNVSRARLAVERKQWRKDHPFGFVAKPEALSDGETNWGTWKCLIPGKAGTNWEGGMYPVTLVFSDDYPAKAPECRFPAQFFHPNVYPSGKICLSIVNDAGWKPSISVKQILVGIQELLDSPNTADPAQEPAWHCLERNPAEYKRRVREQARSYVSDISL